jgi:hypothetical protein
MFGPPAAAAETVHAEEATSAVAITRTALLERRGDIPKKRFSIATC